MSGAHAHGRGAGGTVDHARHADATGRAIHALAESDPLATVGIEFAHVYTDMDGPLDESDVHGLHLAKEIIAQVLGYRLGCSTLIMVDDYSAETIQTAPEEVGGLVIAAGGPAPDAVVRESALADLVEPVLHGVIKRASLRSIRHWHRDTGRWPCSALVATWYLYRLGVGPFSSDEHVLTDLEGGLVPRSATMLVNVLADKHQESERRAAAIIAGTPWADAVHRVHAVYFPSAVGAKQFRFRSTEV